MDHYLYGGEGGRGGGREGGRESRLTWREKSQ